MDLGKSKVATSQHLPMILEKFKMYGNFLSNQEFYDQHVVVEDPSITFTIWRRFAVKLRAGVKIKADKIVAKLADAKATEMGLEKKSLKKILAIADLTLDAIVDNPEILESIPVKERMSWLFNAMKARDSRTNVMIKAKEENRKTNMYEDVMKGAQYGGIEGEQVAEDGTPPPIQESSDEVVEPPPEPAPAVEPAPVESTPPQKVEFNPNQLDNVPTTKELCPTPSAA